MAADLATRHVQRISFALRPSTPLRNLQRPSSTCIAPQRAAPRPMGAGTMPTMRVKSAR